MTFATVSDDRQQLAALSQLLIRVFPGSTIHQNRDPMQMAQRLSSRGVDVILADRDLSSGLTFLMGTQSRNTPVYLLCRQDEPPQGAENFRGVLTYPITEQKLRTVLQEKPHYTQGDRFYD